MKSKKEFVWSIIIKSMLIIIGTTALIISLFFNKSSSGGKILVYFTIQSNIWILVFFIIFLIMEILCKIKNKNLFSNNFYIIKFIFTIAITLTFVVFGLLLAPSLPIKYLCEYTNIAEHFLVPILAIIDFFLFDYPMINKKFDFLYPCIAPLYYFIYVMIAVEMGVPFGNDKFPYFFLNYEKLGWFKFTSQGIGVAYWFIIICGFLIGVSLLFIFLKNKIRKIKYNKEI